MLSPGAGMAQNQPMKKWLMYVVMVILVGGSWVLFAKSGWEIRAKTEELRKMKEQGASDEEVSHLEARSSTRTNERIVGGVLLAFVSAGLVGIFFVLEILPSFAHRLTHAIYDSAEMVEQDVMHDARSLLAQGDYMGAIKAFREAAAAEPLNRLPWIEIAKIHKERLGNPAAAVQTIRYALESQEWEINDAAYFLFRLAELYDEVEGNRASAVAIMRQVVEQFPGTRHSANANHKLHEWGIDKSPVTLAPGQPT